LPNLIESIVFRFSSAEGIPTRTGSIQPAAQAHNETAAPTPKEHIMYTENKKNKEKRNIPPKKGQRNSSKP